MPKIPELQQSALAATAENGISSILFRNAMARKLGLNVTESMCISLLGIKRIATPTELAKYTGLTTGSITSLLDRLEQQGIIKRKPNPNDRRGVLIEIDEGYGAKSAQMVVGIQTGLRELIASYSDAELKLITDFLNRFTENTVRHTKDIEEGRAQD